ncbi:CRP/FNR family transcriptional regulator [Litorivivens lipolytica]|uniref:CRP/FNR family transcriptional regulator n=1 Tax=Litorivivens lipolytica TaxID=1524264 RepID=A0A7W4W4X2_9GAMM|nr:helix-turn-helix domain-containing protein [Litorivivens lipolytica]MBB3047469.1 CRP/FNR family transcriptional regulator [Litorivivens lipolytica]
MADKHSPDPVENYISLMRLRGESKCSECALLNRCLPRSLADTNLLPIFESAVSGNFAIDAGEDLLSDETKFSLLFIVKSGTFKAINRINEANIQAFYFSGNLIGLEAIGQRQFDSRIIALERSVICAVDYDKLLDLLNRLNQVKKHFIETISLQHLESLRLFAIIRSGSVQQRVAAFLLFISEQQKRRGQAFLDMVLPMGRTDISNFLGVSPESLSRTLTSLSKKRLIKVFNRRVTLMNYDALSKMLSEAD